MTARKTRLALCVTMTSAIAVAGVLDKAWLKGTTDRDPLSYAPGEKIVFTITPEGLGGDIPEGEYSLSWKLTDDYGRREEGIIPFSAEPFIFETTLDRPGFVRLQASVPGAGREIFFDGSAAVEPNALAPSPEPPDFDDFWKRQFARLDLVPIKADQVEIDMANSKVRLFAARIDCAGLRPVTGYLSIPKAIAEGKTFPARLVTFGYNGSCRQDRPNRAREDEIVLEINVHGHKLPEFGATEADLKAFRWEFNPPGRPYAFDAAQNADPETAYFNGMVLRVKRALQFLKTVKGWNGTDLIASGGSQGGLQTLWAAACGEGLTLALPEIPWCCDMASNERRLAGKASSDGWYIPWTESMGYYDPVNFARRIPKTCRVVITRAGLGDYCCPPMGIAKLWNSIHSGNKKIVWVQGSRHGFVPPPYDGRDTLREE